MLAKRLKLINNWVTLFAKSIKIVLDIGTDHGQLARNIAQFNPKILVIGSDLRKHIIHKRQIEPLNQQIKNLKFVVSDGFENIKEKIDLVILAGLGYQTIEKILNQQLSLAKFYIIQTRNNPINLRKWFAKKGFGFEKDIIFVERNIFYHTLLLNVKGRKHFNEKNIQFGDFENKDKSFINYWQRQIVILTNIMEKLPIDQRTKFYNSKILPIKEIV